MLEENVNSVQTMLYLQYLVGQEDYGLCPFVGLPVPDILSVSVNTQHAQPDHPAPRLSGLVASGTPSWTWAAVTPPIKPSVYSARLRLFPLCLSHL